MCATTYVEEEQSHRECVFCCCRYRCRSSVRRVSIGIVATVKIALESEEIVRFRHQGFHQVVRRTNIMYYIIVTGFNMINLNRTYFDEPPSSSSINGSVKLERIEFERMELERTEPERREPERMESSLEIPP
jgi:hypothetical protein